MQGKSRTPAKPAPPGTATSVHVLTGGGRAPEVWADARLILDQPTTYLHLSVDDRQHRDARHLVDVTLSGPPDDVAALVAEMAAAVAEPRPEPEQQ